MNLIVNTLSEIIAFFIGWTLGIVWRWLRTKLTTRSFWNVNPDGRVVIAVSLPQRDPSEHTVNIPTGDTLAFGEIVSLLKHLYPKTEVAFYTNPEKPIPREEWNATVILIGGGKSNITSRCILAALDPPLYGRDHLHPQHDYKGLRDKNGNVIIDQIFEDKRLSVDYGYLIRTWNPFYRDKFVYIFIGGYSIGTYGAAHWATQPKNLAWLRRDLLGQHLGDLLRGQAQCDSFEVIVKVPTRGRYPEIEIPILGQIEVHHREGRKIAYHFSAPDTDTYREKYIHWANSYSQTPK